MITTTVTATLVHQCPFVDELDVGEVVIVWPGPAVELHELRAYLDTFRLRAETHERVTAEIAATYRDARVTTRWRTAGMIVEVEAIDVLDADTVDDLA